MKYTLLELCQSILSSMDGDEVNSISDTSESLQVANIVKECFYDIVGEFSPAKTKGLFHLDASGDNLKPCIMTMPAHGLALDVLKYNIEEDADLTKTTFRDLDYVQPNEFLEYMNGLDQSETWVGSQVVTIQGQDFPIKFRNDQSPTYYTSFDDKTMIFDSYDSSYEDTLTSSRTYCIGPLIKIFLMQDTYVPDLDASQFQLLLQSAKSQAFIEVKQTTNIKAEQKERRNRVLLQKNPSALDNRSALEKLQEGFAAGRRSHGSARILNSRTRNGT